MTPEEITAAIQDVTALPFDSFKEHAAERALYEEAISRGPDHGAYFIGHLIRMAQIVEGRRVDRLYNSTDRTEVPA